MPGRKPAAITGEAARERVQRMRAMNDAVLTGIGTVLADDPQLTCRLPGMEQPLAGARGARQRACGFRRGSRLAGIAPRARSTGRSPSETAPQDKERALTELGVEVLRVPGANGRLDLAAVLRGLAGRGITRVMVEAGPILSAAFLARRSGRRGGAVPLAERARATASMRWKACRSAP